MALPCEQTTNLICLTSKATTATSTSTGASSSSAATTPTAEATSETTATSSATTTAAKSTTTSASAEAAVTLGLGVVQGHLAAIDLTIFHGLLGGLAVFLAVEVHKAKAAGEGRGEEFSYFT